ncbi:transcription initiation factor TFIIH subunit 2 [Nematocida homosporus]|uniref:transcription initiation factor TFIIH subunit 2 n=1 Tax=Nematocida homosporus TaxID=1912981 RepID=UPI00221E79A7|nr:transcription initiation factor TFIIH subunit 2 [Nematocida homosporus]KAI5186573.1 transcription initiation factor TFIIH subunit 2 [Nematocida homosporus]
MEESRFRWEEKFQNTWDGAGKEEAAQALRVNRRTENVQRGVVRRVLLIVDMSEAVEERDLLPSRRSHIKNAVCGFYRGFSESNPLSTLGVVGVADGTAQMVASVVAEEEVLEDALGGRAGSGRFSLFAALEAAAVFFQGSHFLKEIILIVSSFSFFGKSPYQQINNLLAKGVKIHTVHMAGEMDILRRMSTESGGVFGVVTAPEDLGTLLDLVCVPAPHSSAVRLSMVQVGFPAVIHEESICACHLRMTSAGYECPFCTTKVCSLPGVCPICEGILSTAVHLLKALHWTDSAPMYITAEGGECRVCRTKSSSRHACPGCDAQVCLECSAFVRQELNFCIFCPN